MIKELFSLRFIFIFFIFLHHVALFDGGGSMAVAFFFILGGFSLSLGYKERLLRDDFSYKAFIKKRCIKFYPLHWICLILAVPFVLLHFKLWQIPNFILNALLIQTWIPLKPIYFSYNAVSWYLADTMFLAIIFPFLFRFIYKATKRTRIIFVFSIIIIYILLLVLLPTKWLHAILYINPLVRTIDFIIGIFLALLYFQIKDNIKILNIVQKNYYLFVILVFIFIGTLIQISQFLTENQRMQTFYYWIPICILIITSSLISIVYGGGYKNILQNKHLVRLGECSFVFYMIHQLIICYYKIIFDKLFQIDNKVFFVSVCLITTIVLSLLIYDYIEKPLIKWLAKKI